MQPIRNIIPADQESALGLIVLAHDFHPSVSPEAPISLGEDEVVDPIIQAAKHVNFKCISTTNSKGFCFPMTWNTEQYDLTQAAEARSIADDLYSVLCDVSRLSDRGMASLATENERQLAFAVFCDALYATTIAAELFHIPIEILNRPWWNKFSVTIRPALVSFKASIANLNGCVANYHSQCQVALDQPHEWFDITKPRQKIVELSNIAQQATYHLILALDAIEDEESDLTRTLLGLRPFVETYNKWVNADVKLIAAAP